MHNTSHEKYDAYIALGGNIGQSRSIFNSAINLIKALPDTTCLTTSSLYKTAAQEGAVSQDDFTNAAVKIGTALNPAELMYSLLCIEKKLGRIRNQRHGPRVIDLDLIHHDASPKSLDPKVLLPHPRAHQRAFVLAPLVEINPHLQLFDLGCVHTLLVQCQNQPVKRCDPVPQWPWHHSKPPH